MMESTKTRLRILSSLNSRARIRRIMSRINKLNKIKFKILKGKQKRSNNLSKLNKNLMMDLYLLLIMTMNLKCQILLTMSARSQAETYYACCLSNKAQTKTFNLPKCSTLHYIGWPTGVTGGRSKYFFNKIY